MRNKSKHIENPPTDIEIGLEDQFLSKKKFIGRKKLVEIIFEGTIKELHEWNKFDSPRKAFSEIAYNANCTSYKIYKPEITQEHINAGRAYQNFSKWIAIDFPDETGYQPDIFPQCVTYPMGKLFEWIEAEKVFKKLELFDCMSSNESGQEVVNF
jgi:hypothetical protein